ncbi:MAG: class I SAM-dependent methyltransferase [Pseudomonadota bacterium]
MSLGHRLHMALEHGVLTLPETGRLAVFGPVAGSDMSSLPQDRCDIISTFRPDKDHFEAQGWTCQLRAEGRYTLALVTVARARALTLSRLAEAASVCDGVLVVDGEKKDGVEAILKACRSIGETGASVSKSHGKLFTFSPGPDVASLRQTAPTRINGTYVTAPGVFSSDDIDPGSALLAEKLPERLGPFLADFGAGWGYLANQALARQGVEKVYLVEAEHNALDCARLNVVDPRADFHWADVTNWQAPEPLDAVVMNPPFHIGRSADPSLGRAFIQAAARQLKPRGALFMVANRHLPYEATLEKLFGRVDSLANHPQFKVLMASRPSNAGSRFVHRTGSRSGSRSGPRTDR